MKHKKLPAFSLAGAPHKLFARHTSYAPFARFAPFVLFAICSLLALYILFAGGSAAWAAPGSDISGASQPDLKIYVNGAPLVTDAPAIIMGERTMVPVRAVSEAIGCRVAWFEDEQRVVIFTPVRDDPFMELHIDDHNVAITMHDYSGGSPERWAEDAATDTSPTIINGRTYLPLRFVSEWMGFTVIWDEAEWAVYLDNRTSDAEIAKRIAGTWHMMNFIASGYGKRFAFDPDGTYILGADTAHGSFGNTKGGYVRELFSAGSWKIVGGRLVLLPEKRLMAESAVNMNGASDNESDMFDAEYSLRLLESAAPRSYTVTFNGPDPESGRESVSIDYETYYAFDSHQGLMDHYYSLIDAVGDGIPEKYSGDYRVMEDIYFDRMSGKIMPYAGGVLQKASFYHDGMEEYLSFYFVEIGPGQYMHMMGNTELLYDTVEIQVYSTTIDLEPYVGQFFQFWGEHFEAHTIHHRRDIVMNITQIR